MVEAVTPLRVPAPAPRRSRSLHWGAWLLAVVALALLSVAMFARLDAAGLSTLAYADLVLTVMFALEFFTRSGWRTHRSRYLRWRWFDFIAMVPAVYGTGGAWPAALLWIVLACRLMRAIDRTLGDGFILRQVLTLISALEEEITDRVVDRVLVRWQNEIAKADFGQKASEALLSNKQPILKRIYEEQLKTGTLAKLVQYSGLRANLEREEALIFDEIVTIVASAEVDKAIRDVVAASFASVRTELGTKSWRAQLGHTVTDVP